MMLKLAMLCLGLALLTPANAAERTRDWTVERPMLAGYLRGLSLCMCARCTLGARAEHASPHDPFAMTPAVRAQLTELGRRPYQIGLVAGVASTIYVLIGVIFRWRNRLGVVEEVV